MNAGQSGRAFSGFKNPILNSEDFWKPPRELWRKWWTPGTSRKFCYFFCITLGSAEVQKLRLEMNIVQEASGTSDSHARCFYTHSWTALLHKCEPAEHKLMDRKTKKKSWTFWVININISCPVDNINSPSFQRKTCRASLISETLTGQWVAKWLIYTPAWQMCTYTHKDTRLQQIPCKESKCVHIFSSYYEFWLWPVRGNNAFLYSLTSLLHPETHVMSQNIALIVSIDIWHDLMLHAW